jgi:N utilization substance protein B
MKTSHDPRHHLRVKTVKELFSWGSLPTTARSTVKLNNLSTVIVKNISEIDQQIKSAAPDWPLEQINKIDLAILRIAVFELLIIPDLKNKKFSTIPFKVTVDEAVELAKEFGAESSPSFINGVLGHLITVHKIDPNSKIS